MGGQGDHTNRVPLASQQPSFRITVRDLHWHVNQYQVERLAIGLLRFREFDSKFTIVREFDFGPSLLPVIANQSLVIRAIPHEQDTHGRQRAHGKCRSRIGVRLARLAGVLESVDSSSESLWSRCKSAG